MGEEGLAVPGVAEYEDEPGLVGGQPCDDLIEGGGGHRAAGRGGCTVDPPDALRYVQLGWVVPVGAQPVGLPPDVAAQVQHALVLGHAQQPYPAPLGVVDQLRRGLRPGCVDEVGEQARPESGHVRGPDASRELLDRGRVRGAVEQTDEPAQHDAAPVQAHMQVGGQPAGRLDPRDRRVRVAQAGHLGDVVQPVGRPPQRPGRPVGMAVAVHAPAILSAPVWACFVLGVVIRVGERGLWREGRVHRPERARCAYRPGVPGRVDAQVTRPPFLVGLIAAGIPGEAVPVDAEQLVLVGHRSRAGMRADRRAAGGDDRQPGGQPVRPPVVGVAVQQQVQPRAEDAVQVVGVAQVLVIGGGAPDRVVMHGADPQPAIPLVAAKRLGDGTQLALTEPAVMLLV